MRNLSKRAHLTGRGILGHVNQDNSVRRSNKRFQVQAEESTKCRQLRTVMCNIAYCGNMNKTINQIKLKIPFECMFERVPEKRRRKLEDSTP